MKKITAIVVSALLILTTTVFNTEKVHAAIQSTITRSQVEQRALSMINLNWTFSSAKNSLINPTYISAVTLPKQFANLTISQMTGIPYAWGGFDSLDSNSYNVTWNSFLDAVNQGAYTGNVNAHGGLGYVPGTAGLDCSGFVQAAFNIKDYKQSTSTLLANYFTIINLNDLKHMDILDLPGNHVVIFDSWGSINGLEGAFTYEATTDQTFGGIQGTKKYFISKAQINTGYIPARFNFISEDQAAIPTPTPEATPTTTTDGTPTLTPVPTPSPTPVATPTPAPVATPTLTPVPTPSPTPVATPSALPHPVNTGIFAQISNVADLVNIHSSALNSSTILSALPKGSILYINNYSSGWYQVIYNGSSGWVWGGYITNIPSGQFVTVKNAYQLNIRSSPSSTALIIGIIKQNQYAQVLTYSSDKQWMKISIGGIQGWAYTTYLSYIY